MPSKYAFYEASVQTPKIHADWFGSIYREHRGKYARVLREDFCGTFAVSAEWVKRNRRNSAHALDLDPKPLAYGRRTHLATLNAEQRKRLHVKRADVFKAELPRADLVAVGNFSFYFIKERTKLVDYLKRVRRSLNPGGVLILEMAGGPGMINPVRDRKVVARKHLPTFTYIWDQQYFDPITHYGRYQIHFKLKGGKELRGAFTYDWRLWTIPEVREILADAGFASTTVYWETEHEGQGTGEYLPAEMGDNAWSWLAYVAALK